MLWRVPIGQPFTPVANAGYGSSMTKPTPKQTNPPNNLDAETYARLKSELKAPYRGVRKFIYLACGASGLIGAFIFLMQLLAGRDVNAALPNFALQVGVVALMGWLYQLEQRRAKSD